MTLVRWVVGLLERWVCRFGRGSWRARRLSELTDRRNLEARHSERSGEGLDLAGKRLDLFVALHGRHEVHELLAAHLELDANLARAVEELGARYGRRVRSRLTARVVAAVWRSLLTRKLPRRSGPCRPRRGRAWSSPACRCERRPATRPSDRPARSSCSLVTETGAWRVVGKLQLSGM